MAVLITGGAGLIGSEFSLDKLIYVDDLHVMTMAVGADALANSRRSMRSDPKPPENVQPYSCSEQEECFA